MTQALAAVALVLGGFILGMWAAAKLYSYTFRALQKYNIDIVIEDREPDFIAIVMRIPEEHRELAEKIVKKAKEKS